METLLAGAELEDVPVFEVCGSRLVGFEYVVVVPSSSEETVLGVEILQGSVWRMGTVRGGMCVLEGMPDPVSTPSSRLVDSHPRSGSAWSSYLRSRKSDFVVRLMPPFGELD